MMRRIGVTYVLACLCLPDKFTVRSPSGGRGRQEILRHSESERKSARARARAEADISDGIVSSVGSEKESSAVE